MLFKLLLVLFRIMLTDSLQYCYVMVFMSNVRNRDSQPIQIFIGNPTNMNSSGKLYTPLLDQYGFSVEFNILSHQGTNFSANESLRLHGTGLQHKTFVIESSIPLSVIGLNREQNSADSFLSFPTTSFGLEYFTVSYANDGVCFTNCQFAIVAIYNETVINITLPSTNFSVTVHLGNKTYSNGSTIQVTLQEYQVFQVQSSNDLTGTHIIGDHSFAVFSGNQKTNINRMSKDHLVEQLIPVESLGRVFTVIPTPDQSGDVRLIFRVIATQDGTVVRVNNETEYHVDAGKWFEVNDVSDEYYTVTSNHPVMVMDFLLLGGHSTSDRELSTDPCLIAIVPREQWQSAYFFNDIDIYTNYLIVVIEDSVKEKLLLNSEPVIDIQWQSVKASTLVGGYIKLDKASSNYLTCQNASVTFGVYVYGRVRVETHCTVAGVDLDPKNVPVTDEETSTLIKPSSTILDKTFSTKDVSSSFSPEMSSTFDSDTHVAFSSSLMDHFSFTASFISNSVLEPISNSDYTSAIPITASIESSDGPLFNPLVTDTLMSPSSSSKITPSPSGQNIDPSITRQSAIAVPSVHRTLCQCPCVRTKINASETEKIISSIQKELFVDKRKVSKTLRKTISASDNRVSSTGIGIVGVAFILATLGTLVLLDLPKIFRDFKSSRRSD